MQHIARQERIRLPYESVKVSLSDAEWARWDSGAVEYKLSLNLERWQTWAGKIFADVTLKIKEEKFGGINRHQTGGV